MPYPEVALHPLPAEVKIPVAQPEVFVDPVGGLGNFKRKRGGWRQEKEVLRHNFPVSGLHGRIGRPFRPGPYLPPDGEHKFAAEVSRPFVDFGSQFGIEDYLDPASSLQVTDLSRFYPNTARF